MTPTGRVVVIGAGVAGLACAERLAAQGADVVVIEREDTPASHASAHNAAIFRHAEPRAPLVRLACRSRHLYDALVDDDVLDASWLRRCGALYVGTDDVLGPIADAVRTAGLAACTATRPADVTVQPSETTLWVHDDGVMEPHAMTQALLRRLRQQRGHLQLRTAVERIRRDGDQVTGVVLSTGEVLEADLVVNAAGAWASLWPSTSHLPLRPLRRHLTLLRAPSSTLPCVVWRLTTSTEAYARPDPVGALASSCDETQVDAGVPSVDPDVHPRLASRLSTLLPQLVDDDVGVATTWACLRTFAADRELVVGPDPRLSGLWWCAGLGGHGMTLAYGAADALAQAVVTGDLHRLQPFLPSRFAPSNRTAA